MSTMSDVSLRGAADIRCKGLRHEDVTVLVNNAGAVSFGSLLTGPLDDAHAMFRTNVFGPWEMTRVFAPALAASGGAMVSVLSAIAWFSPPQNGAYAATKAAAWSLTNGLRMGLESAGVLVQGLHFGAVDTDFAAGYDGTKIAPGQVVNASLEGLEAEAPEVLVDAESRNTKAALSGAPGEYLRRFLGSAGS
ncbi:MAG TPA: SDR family NAD(P)-dependent oxidoreductase [Candidatus Nesterenkonia stercoripullorum]|uniref:SDR family NAD(P)-dependent oxidoreductase n=1 Tax=Candidatus Nesterenkonia stercoripullorum TaxID=2838701 RepID=A0A9D1UR56_9MICC|nr:SDR family NAD(P)-dependent oxidoreductase [Candidatus Nesterenkonia stercoripullorum]